jgi:4-hydroxybenzoate polyprenyltransferase
MIKLKALLKASHFGPTLIVTTIGFWFSWYYLNFLESLLVAFGVFTGQLVVGWSNDLYDLADDLKHQRLSKPLVVESINTDYLINWLKIMTPLSFALNLLGPLGLEGGLVYQLGIACGVAYNFYFKFSWMSPLPFAVAFAALPSSIAISAGVQPPVWMWLGGASLGVAAHFINVLKDMKQDQQSEIRGLPQRLGSRNSKVAAGVLVFIGLTTVFMAVI